MKTIQRSVKCFLISMIMLVSLGSMAQDYTLYHNQINEAKLMAAKQQYLESARLFKQTFETFDFEYARDCYHAVEVSSLTSDSELIGYLLERALHRGIPISVFTHKKELASFRETQLWIDLEKRADEIYQSYEAAINQKLRKEINDMFSKDQAIRTRYYKRLLFRGAIGKQWQALNTQQVNRLIEITQEYGFPGERLIGIDRSIYHEKISDGQLSTGMPIVILIHHYSSPNPSFDAILIDQVKSGNLFNEHFATICDFQAQYGQNKHPTKGPYNFKFDSGNDTKELNKKRASIGLMTIEQLEGLSKNSMLTRFWKRLY